MESGRISIHPIAFPREAAILLAREDFSRRESRKMNQQSLQKVGYTHDAVIDEILLNPSVSQGELARMFGYGETWISICVNSDAFKERLAERKAEVVDPIIRASIQDRLDAVAKKALDKIMDVLDDPDPLGLKIKHADLIAMAKLGIGDKNNRPTGPQVNTNNLYVIHSPAPAQNTKDWMENVQGNTPRGVLPMVEVVPGV